jgi:uncharacterized protein YndB with AHSA1/START domain
MNSNLLFNFTVKEDASTILVTREFNLKLNLVWSAFTEPAILDQWWAPKPYRTETKSMAFSVGGTWLYAMVAPTGEKASLTIFYFGYLFCFLGRNISQQTILF